MKKKPEFRLFNFEESPEELTIMDELVGFMNIVTISSRNMKLGCTLFIDEGTRLNSYQ